ncbi:MAG: hypothetical protein PHG97_06535 [Candidatus Margulisbacteria bacterium]|nr:hypothetical protein [Candidatus Margulisiibacteriota bacterium]
MVEGIGKRETIYRSVVARARSYAQGHKLPLKEVFRSMGLLDAREGSFDHRMEWITETAKGRDEAYFYLHPWIKSSSDRGMKCREGDRLKLLRDTAGRLYGQDRIALEKMLAAVNVPEPSGGWVHKSFIGSRPRFIKRGDDLKYEFEMDDHFRARNEIGQIRPEAERILKEREVFSQIEEKGWEAVLRQEINKTFEEWVDILGQISTEALSLLGERRPFIPAVEGTIRLRAAEEKLIGGPLKWVEDFDRRDIPAILDIVKSGGHVLSPERNNIENGLAGRFTILAEPRVAVPSGAQVRTATSHVCSEGKEFIQRKLLYNGKEILEGIVVGEPLIMQQEQ